MFRLPGRQLFSLADVHRYLPPGSDTGRYIFVKHRPTDVKWCCSLEIEKNRIIPHHGVCRAYRFQRWFTRTFGYRLPDGNPQYDDDDGRPGYPVKVYDNNICRTMSCFTRQRAREPKITVRVVRHRRAAAPRLLAELRADLRVDAVINKTLGYLPEYAVVRDI